MLHNAAVPRYGCSDIGRPFSYRWFLSLARRWRSFGALGARFGRHPVTQLYERQSVSCGACLVVKLEVDKKSGSATNNDANRHTDAVVFSGSTTWKATRWSGRSPIQ
jgi:hypothetical protein